MRCGPFELVRPIGRGGMAEVWEARHGTTTVAVKLIDLTTPESLADFSTEVRAHARLQHPSILQVLDFGQLAHPVTGGSQRGTPWLALEYASGGTLLDRLRLPLGWDEIRETLLAILDALGHAHAHGVIHKDLKPANILLSRRSDLRPGLKLADFGIAHLQDPGLTGENGIVAGTRTSMAPEQISGAFREYGPWTDLYALGCLAYRMASGRWPFHGLGQGMLRAHLTTPAPRLPDGLTVPRGFSDWVDHLLQKEPRNRPRTAADALHALLLLGEDVPTARLVSPLRGDNEPTENELTTGSLHLRATLRAAWGDTHTATSGGIAPFADDWRRAAAELPLPLRDAGLALFGMRSLDAVGRDKECDLLWSALRAVRATGRPRAVVLTGPAGVGISHLGDYFTRRAESLGAAAHTFVVRGEAHDAPDEALLRALAQDLRVENLTGAALQRVLPSTLALWGPPDPALQAVIESLLERQVRSHSVRRGAIRRVLRDRARGRAVIVWIDDAHLCPDGLAFASATLRHAPEGLPLLFVVGAGSIEGEGSAFERLRDLASADRAETLELGALTRLQSQMLVQHALPLATAVQAPIVAAANGLPGALLDPVRRLVEADALVSSPRGFELAPGASLDVANEGPTDLHRAAVASLLDAPPAVARELVLAAVLGLTVRHDLWTQASEDPDAKLPAHSVPIAALRRELALTGRLINAGLAIETRDGWRFTDPRFREAILLHAPGPLLVEARLAVASVLSRLPEAHRSDVRIARLYRAAGQTERALELYEQALLSPTSKNLFRRGELTLVCDEALEVLASSPNAHTTHAALWDALNARAMHGAADMPESEARSIRMVQEGRQRGWPLVLGLTHAVMASRAANEVDHDAFEHHLRQAREALATAPNVPTTLDARIVIARALRRFSRFDQALVEIRGVLAEARLRDWTQISMRAAPIEADLLRRAGHELPLEELLARAEHAQSLGYIEQSADLLTTGGEVAYTAGDYAFSNRMNERCFQIIHDIGIEEPTPALNLSRNALMQGDALAARRWLDRLRTYRAVRWFPVELTIMELCWSALSGDTRSCRQLIADLERQRDLVALRKDPDFVDLFTKSLAHLSTLAPHLATRLKALGATI